MRPHDMPPAERFPHGTTARYTSGCRCDACKGAQRESGRQYRLSKKLGTWEPNGFVPALAARNHIRKLRRLGIGKKSIANFACVPYSAIDYIRSGVKRTIRAKTERRILAVDASCTLGGTRVPIGPTLKRVAWLVEEGFSRLEIARRAGFRHGLQFLYRRGACVASETADRIERVYRQFFEVAA